MLKKLLYFFLFYVMFVFSANSQQITYTPQTANGYQFKYLKVDSLFHLSVGDTSLKKGVARAGAIVFRNADSLYYGYNGVRWVLLGGTGKVNADYGLINVNDSTLKADSLQLTTLAKSYKIVDSLDKLYLKLTGGIVTGTVDIQQPLSLGEGGVSRGRLNFFNEDNGNTGSLSSIPYTSNREWLLPDYDGTLTTEDSLRSKTDSLLNIINGRATFGDVRDMVNDSMDYVRSNFQPLENQRLSTTDSVTFSKVYAKTKFVTGEYGSVDGKLEYIDRGSGNVGTLQNTTLTNNRSWSLPNQSGEIALTSDINDSINYVRGNYVKYTDTSSMLSGYKSASILSSGTLSDGRLSSNIPKLDAANVFTNSTQTFANSNIFIGTGASGSNFISVRNNADNGWIPIMHRQAALGNSRVVDLANINNISANAVSVGSSAINTSYITSPSYYGWLRGGFAPENNLAPTNWKNVIFNMGSDGVFRGISDSAGFGYIFHQIRKVPNKWYIKYIQYKSEDTIELTSKNIYNNGRTITLGLATNYKSISNTDYTLTTTNKQINVAATTNNVYINLLTSVGNDGQEWSIRRISDTNQYKVIIKPTSGQKINGADSLILFAKNNNVTLKSDGADYIIVDRYNTAKANTPAAAEDLSNISSVTPKKRIYTQTDSVVSVTEYYEVTLTTAGTASSFAVKTPIPTTFTSIYDAIGVGAVTIVDDFTSPTTRKSASAVITSVNSSNKVLVQLNDDADSGNTKRIVTLNYQYILK